MTNAADTNAYFATGNAGIVGIFPSISRFMNLKIPLALEREVDGVPLIGDISISSPAASLNQESREITVTWKNWQNAGDVKIWGSTTNHYHDGGEDRYTLLAEVPLADQKAVIDVSGLPSAIFKIALEAPENIVNTWLMPKEE